MKKGVTLFILCFLSLTYMHGQKKENKLLDKLVEKNVLTESEAADIRKETLQTEAKPALSQSIDKVRNAFNTPYMQFGGNGQMMSNILTLVTLNTTSELKIFSFQ